MIRFAPVAICSIISGAICCLIPTSAVAQTVEIQHFTSFANDSIVAENQGIGVGFRLDMAEWLALALEYNQTVSESTREGVACGTIDQGMIGCETALVDDHVALRGLRAILMPTVLGGALGHISGRIGLTGTVPEVSSEGRVYDELRDRQKVGNTFVSRGAHLGLIAGAKAEFTPLRRVPIGLTVGGALHRIFFDDCHTDPNMHTPFCGAIDLRELHVGATLHLPRGHH